MAGGVGVTLVGVQRSRCLGAKCRFNSEGNVAACSWSGFSALGGNGRSGGVQKSDGGCEIKTHCHGFYKQLVGGCSEKSMFWCQVTIQL